jgi:hypothetical protein
MTGSSENNMNNVAEEVNQMDAEYGKNFKIITASNSLKGLFSSTFFIVNNFIFRLPHKILHCLLFHLELQTIIRDKTTSRSDFKFYADRLIRLVIEESLNQLSYSDCSVVTPTGNYVLIFRKIYLK